MSALSVAVACAAGALTGSAARSAVFTLAVPQGQPTRRACPSCSADLAAAHRPMSPLGRCPACRSRIPPGALVPELLAAAAFTAIAAGGAVGWFAAAQYWLAACGVVLILVDLAVRRLPDILTLPACAGTLLLLLGASMSEETGSLSRALAAAGAVGALFLILALAGMGMGDVKLAPAIAALLGWRSWQAVMLGTVTGFLLGGLCAMLLLAAGRGRREQIAYGPFMILGAITVSVLTS
jgi:leader peptidase (prepilin peptidase)/N-methyltransferase